MRATWCLPLLAISIAAGFSPGTADGIQLSNVLVLYNAASTDSQTIADYYAGAHPSAPMTSGIQMLGLTGIGTSEDMTADDYLRVDSTNPGLRQQVMTAITNSPTPIDLIVTTKGLPLRITVTEPVPATLPGNMFPQYVDSGGTLRDISAWSQYSSLESELTSIDKVNSWQMMGDQSVAQIGHFALNPYYGSNSSFVQSAMGMRLTARLDGFTVGDVESAIDRAQHAFIGPSNSPLGPFHFIVDNDPSRPLATRVAMQNLVNNVLTPAGLPLTYDNTWQFVSTSTGPVIGYVSHGTHQGSTPANYIADGLNITLADGAVFHSWESYNAYSFNQGGNIGGQALIAEWLQKGGTAAVGTVQEPGGNTSKVTNEDHMFSMLLQGKTWAEAVWSSNSQLSYVNTLVGDPLMTWKTLTYGDVNMDGYVDMNDLAIMGAHWGDLVASGGYGWSEGDVNSDGVIDASDLALLSAHWGEESSWAAEYAGMAALTSGLMGGSIGPFLASSIPEPSTRVLGLIGAIGLTLCGRRMKRLKCR